MKQVLRLILFVCLMITALASCQREVDGRLSEDVLDDSTTLSKIILLDTTLASGLDTQFVAHFFYDSQARHVGENIVEYDNISGGRLTYFYRYSYRNNDTLPYKISEKYSDDPDDSLISYLTYSNGFIIKDSSADYRAGVALSSKVYLFSTLGGGKYFVTISQNDLTTGLSIVIDSTVYTRGISAGNVVSGLDSTWMNRNPFTLSRVKSFQNSFDNKYSPFGKLSLWYLGFYDNFDNQIYYDFGANNLLSEREDFLFPSGSANSLLYSHTYNVHNYPIITRATGSGATGTKVLYYYTTL